MTGTTLPTAALASAETTRCEAERRATALAESMIAEEQFSLPQDEKTRQLGAVLRELHLHHCSCSSDYRRIVEALFPAALDPESWEAGLTSAPYLPVAIFKRRAVASIPAGSVFKTLTSSGTTGEVSRIVLDRPSAMRQTAALASVMRTILGPDRLPMLIVDHPGVIRDRREFSARGAGILGMTTFGRAHRYVLDSEMGLDEAGLREFLDRFGSAPFLVFGFTFMVWRHLLGAVVGKGIDLSNGILVHSGGWKHLQDEAVDAATFKATLRRETGIRRVHSFYGMVEQIGTVFLEGDDGSMYCPNFADIIVRDPVTWEEAPIGEPGIVQVVSALPTSYPGHSLLTEDLAVVHGIDDSPTGWLGKRFSVLGRVPRAELRGCGDSQAAMEALRAGTPLRENARGKS